MPTRDAPAFDFYPERWLVGVASLSDGEQLAYLRLLCHQWMLGDAGLPAEAAALKRLAGKGVTPALLAKFPVGAQGRRRNARLEIVREEQRERILSRRLGAAVTNARRYGLASLSAEEKALLEAAGRVVNGVLVSPAEGGAGSGGERAAAAAGKAERRGAKRAAGAASVAGGIADVSASLGNLGGPAAVAGRVAGEPVSEVAERLASEGGSEVAQGVASVSPPPTTHRPPPTTGSLFPEGGRQGSSAACAREGPVSTPAVLPGKVLAFAPAIAPLPAAASASAAGLSPAAPAPGQLAEPAHVPAVEAVRQWAEAVMAPQECADAFWNDHEARGWSDKTGQPIRNFRASFNGFALRWKSVQAERAAKARGSAAAPRSDVANRVGRYA